MFIHFKTFSERKSVNKLKVLRTYREGEFTSTYFKDFCKAHEIKELFERYILQHNEEVERTKRLIVEMA